MDPKMWQESVTGFLLICGILAVGSVGRVHAGEEKAFEWRTNIVGEFTKKFEAEVDWPGITGGYVFVGLKGVGDMATRDFGPNWRGPQRLWNDAIPRRGAVFPLEVVDMEKGPEKTGTVFRLKVRRPIEQVPDSEKPREWGIYWGKAWAYSWSMHGSGFLPREQTKPLSVRPSSVVTDKQGRVRWKVPFRRVAETNQSVVVVHGESVRELENAVDVVESDGFSWNGPVFEPVLSDPYLIGNGGSVNEGTGKREKVFQKGEE